MVWASGALILGSESNAEFKRQWRCELLRRPEWFAGTLSFGVRNKQLDSALANYDDLRGKRVFLSAGVRDSRVSMPDVTSLGRLLRSFGIHAVLRTYDSSESPTPKMLTDVDHWLMTGVCESTLV